MLISSRVKQHDRGKRLIDFCSEKFRYLTPEQWVERIGEGRYSIDGEVCTEDTILNKDDTLIYDCPPFIEPDADLNYSIIFENEQFLGINKPGNLLVHKKGAAITHNLIYQLREKHTPPFPTADIVNRLDRETSGVVLVSKTKDALRVLSKMFADRRVSKKYLAIVHGKPAEQSGIISEPMKPSTTGELRSKQVIAEDGKVAETRYEVVQSWGDHSLIRLFPKTGRTHQLRVHCLSLGCPIVGDKLYGLSESEFIKWRQDPEAYKDLEFPRHTLHCCAVRFQWEGSEMEITAPLPKDMSELLPQ